MLNVDILPEAGGCVQGVYHREIGAQILGDSPWAWHLPAPDLVAVDDEATWLATYPGGWHSLFPNAGNAGRIGARYDGFHGESALRRWAVIDQGPERLSMETQLKSVDVHMRRDIELQGDVVAITEELVSDDDQRVDAVWCQHAALGGDLLGGDVVVEADAPETISHAEAVSDEISASRFAASSTATTSRVELHPEDGTAGLDYLPQVNSPWASVRRLDGTVGATLSWDARVFPSVWLWTERGATQEPPWQGHAQFIGIEPCTSWPALGAASIAARRGNLLRLSPGERLKTTVRLHAFKPQGPVRGVRPDGRALHNTEEQD